MFLSVNVKHHLIRIPKNFEIVEAGCEVWAKESLTVMSLLWIFPIEQRAGYFVVNVASIFHHVDLWWPLASASSCCGTLPLLYGEINQVFNK